MQKREFTEADFEAARAARAAKKQWALENLKLDWLDAALWLELATKNRVTLPSWYVKATPIKLSFWCRKLLDKDFKERFGVSPSEFIRLNPRLPLRAFIGQCLEEI